MKSYGICTNSRFLTDYFFHTSIAELLLGPMLSNMCRDSRLAYLSAAGAAATVAPAPTAPTAAIIRYSVNKFNSEFQKDLTGV